jgi:hypothetical protein
MKRIWNETLTFLAVAFLFSFSYPAFVNSVSTSTQSVLDLVQWISWIAFAGDLIYGIYTSDNWKIGNPNTVFSPYLVSLYYHLLRETNKGASNKSEFENKYHFRKIGEFILENNIPVRRLDTSIKVTDRLDLVYAFFVNDHCKYIGKTIQGYSRPANYHKNKVMKTANDGILNCLKTNLNVEIFVRSHNVSIEFDGLKLNIIEPIEQALISRYNPEWNNLIP